jgi:prevent-host-death family protein
MASDTTSTSSGRISRVSMLDARRDFGAVIDRVLNGNERVILTRHGKEIAVIVPVGDLTAILVEAGDVPPDQLADHVLSDFRGGRTLEEAEVWATRGAATIARSCAGANGEERFASVWRELARHPWAAFDLPDHEAGEISDPCDTLLPYALMRMLRREKELAIDAEMQNLRMSLTKPRDRQSVLEKIIGMDWKKWPIPVIHELGVKLRQFVDEGKLRLPLTIGESGYHEERILAHFARDLFLTVNGYDGFQILFSPWTGAVDQKASLVWRPVVQPIGGVDVRLVNKDVANADPQWASEEIADEAPIFRHHGYRAYANGAWLARLAAAPDTPARVSEWINSLKQLSPASRPLDVDSLSVRSWILMKGKPVNYIKTEFALLFRFLREKFSQSKVGFDLPEPEAPSDPDPDDVFDDFLLGRCDVLMSGSIHDLLLEEFWIPMNKTFVKIIDKDDFAELHQFIGRPAGQNVLRFSSRLNDHPDIAKLLHNVYRQLAQCLVTSVLQSPGESKRMLLNYITILLAPSSGENWNMGPPNTRWSFAGNSATTEILLNEEMELPSDSNSGTDAAYREV